MTDIRVSTVRTVKPRRDLTVTATVLRLPTGPAFQSLVVRRADRAGGVSVDHVLDNRPVAAADADVHPVVWWDGEQREIFVLAPGAAQATVRSTPYPGGPLDELAEVSLDPSGFASAAYGAQHRFVGDGVVETRRSDGTRIGDWQLRGPHDDDPLDLRPDFPAPPGG
jgi:hypothetical protein